MTPIGRSFTIEPCPHVTPCYDAVTGEDMTTTHRVIGHTLGEMTYVAALGPLVYCEAKVRELENMLRRHQFKVVP